MPLISQSDAMDALAPHSDAMFRIATDPWNEYHALTPASLLVKYGSRTRANSVHDLMVDEATRYAVAAEGVRMFQRKMMRGMVIDDRIAIRFKKLDEDSYSRGHYTKQVEEWRDQVELDGIDATHHLELGYVLNAHDTEVAEVRIVCPSGRNNAWWSRIDRSGMQPVVADLFPPNDPIEQGGAIIKPKGRGVVVPMHRKGDEDQR